MAGEGSPPTNPPPAKRQKKSSATTAASLGFDVLLDIFMRLPSLSTLVRAAHTCRAWRRAVASSRDFRRRFRETHPAPLLGLFFDHRPGAAQGPALPVFPSFVPSRGADRDAAENDLPSPHENATGLITKFAEYGLDARDMAALSGAHTVGPARRFHYKDRVYGNDGEGGADIDPSFAELRRRTCQAGDDAVAPFDEQTPMRFDNAYYKDLVARRGLLTSDQALYGCGGPLDHLVEMYSKDANAFEKDFARAMVKMGAIPPPAGTPVEVRLKCSLVNMN